MVSYSELTYYLKNLTPFSTVSLPPSPSCVRSHQARTIDQAPVRVEARRSVEEVRAALSVATRTQSVQAVELQHTRAHYRELQARATELLGSLDPASPQFKSFLLRFPLLRTITFREQCFKRLPAFLFLDVIGLVRGRSAARCRAVSRSWNTMMENDHLWVEMIAMDLALDLDVEGRGGERVAGWAYALYKDGVAEQKSKLAGGAGGGEAKSSLFGDGPGIRLFGK